MSENLQVIDERVVFEKNFKIYGDLDNPLFLAKDVAEWIDYTKTGDGYYNVNMMLKTVDDDEKVTTNIVGSGGKSTFLTEDGLYEVLMQSRKPIAKQFKKKVKEILKDVRLNGMYVQPVVLDNMLSDPDTMITVLTKYRDEKALRIAAEDREQKEKALKMEAEQKLIEQKPLVEFSEKLLRSKDNILVREFSKIMQDEKIVNFGEKKMYAWLRENGYLNNNNEPYQKYCQYFKLDEGTVNTAWGVKITKTTLIRPKGQVYLYQKLKEKFAA